MQIGDIVEIKDWKGAAKDSRNRGKILRVNGQHVWSNSRSLSNRKNSLAEILWQNGMTGWVATNRLQKVTAA